MFLIGTTGLLINLKESGMPPSLQRKRARAFESQKGKCFYSEFPMWLADPSSHPLWAPGASGPLGRLQCTAEHKVARVDGGSDASRNVVAACRFCNETRHRRRKPLASRQFKEFVDSRVRRGKWHPTELHRLRRKHPAGP